LKKKTKKKENTIRCFRQRAFTPNPSALCLKRKKLILKFKKKPIEEKLHRATAHMRFGEKRKFDIIKASLFPSPRLRQGYGGQAKPAKEAGFS